MSPVIAARMAPLVSADRLQLVWNALPVGNGSTVLTVDQSIVSFCNSGRTIMAIGRLSPEKGFDLLLRALAQARVSIPDLKLVIFGEGPQRQALTELICALQLESSVALAGYHDHASHYLQYGSLFVMSSLTEGLPLVLLEAMASRIPIIATDVGAVRATLRDGACGALVRAGDVPALAHAIKAAMSQREVNTRTLDAAQHAIEENHSLGRMADAYQSCYLSMLRPPSLGGRELMDSSSS